MRPPERVVVLGAGVMGRRLAALLANIGAQVDLLDQKSPDEPDRLAREARASLLRERPPTLFLPRWLDRIRPGNFEDDLDRLGQADWVIEAIVEDLSAKKALLARIDVHLGVRTILSTNTSGLSLRELSRVLSPGTRRRFLGTHFFNPPRQMPLVEVIRAPETDPEVVRRVSAWLRDHLGKEIVEAQDTPNFIANRIGIYSLLRTVQAMEAFGLNPETVDLLTGPLIGRPRSATFRTVDLVGVDTLVHVARYMAEVLPDPAEQAAFRPSPIFLRLLERGWLGDKSGQGFYCRGQSGRLVLDPQNMTYHPPAIPSLPSVAAVRGIPDLPERLRRLIASPDVAGRFVWTVVKDVLLYAARVVDEVAAGDKEAVDKAMRFGFQWELGPFELWQSLGVAAVAQRMAAEGERLPDWLTKAISAGAEHFYVPTPPPWPNVGRLREAERIVWRSDAVDLLDGGDGLWVLDLHPQRQVIGAAVVADLHRALDHVGDEATAIVLIGPESGHFSLGADLAALSDAAERGAFTRIEAEVRAFQDLNRRLRYLPLPVVAAPAGYALGAGAELCLAACRIQAAADCYLGLPEVAVGLVPAGGGTVWLLRRALAFWPPDLPSHPGEGQGNPTLYVDPAPFVARMFGWVAAARVASSAFEARELGFLTPADGITRYRPRLLADASALARYLAQTVYRPPEPDPLPAPGREVWAVLVVGIDEQQRRGTIQAEEAELLKSLALLFTGGDVPAGRLVPEEDWLLRERETFLQWLGRPATRERIRRRLARQEG